MKRKNSEPEELPVDLAGLGELCDKLWEQIVDENVDSKKQKEHIVNYNIAAQAYNDVAGEARMTIITDKTILTTIRPENEGDPPKPNKLSKKFTDKVNSQRDIKVGDVIKICFAGSAIDVKVNVITEMDTFKVNDGDGVKYHIKRDDIMRPGDTAKQHIAKMNASKPKPEKEALKEKAPRKAKEGGGQKVEPINRPLQQMKKTKEIDKILAQDVPGAVMIREVFDLDPKNFHVEDFETMSGINKSRIIGCLRKYDKAKNFKF